MNFRNRFVLCAALALGTLAAAPAFSQSLELPAASPAAKVSQRVGVTDFAVEYASPAVNGRKIWGDLVPLDKPWRTGANAATKLTSSQEFSFGGTKIPAGTYSIVTIPTAQAWTVILSKDLALWGGGRAYDAKDDVARIQVTPTAIPHRERLTFLFADTTEDKASLDLEWEKLRVSIPLAVDTAAHAKANIDAALGGAWRPFAQAGRYLVESRKDYAGAIAYFDKSIGIQSTWYNNWLKAEALAAQNKKGEARKFAQIAWDLGQKDANFFYKDRVQKALKEWK